MTDHLPNDLSHLSDAEFHLLCPQGEHAPGPQPLSPAAQAVASAYDNTPEKDTDNHRYLWLAAALRAAVHWLAYETQLDDPMMTTTHVVNADDLDRIADELDGLS